MLLFKGIKTFLAVINDGQLHIKIMDVLLYDALIDVFILGKQNTDGPGFGYVFHRQQCLHENFIYNKVRKIMTIIA
jgi:hypothetical protein